MIKVADYLYSVERIYGKEIRRKTFENLLIWSNQDASLTQAFYNKSVLDDMLNYALTDY